MPYSNFQISQRFAMAEAFPPENKQKQKKKPQTYPLRTSALLGWSWLPLALSLGQGLLSTQHAKFGFS